MAKFTIGGTGGSNTPKARGLPNGTLVRIVGMDVRKSNFPKKYQKGPKAGEEYYPHQLLVTYEAREEGTTKPYKTKKGPVPATPFNVGDRFAQYLGGVWPNDDDPEDINLTENGGAYAFVAAMEELGVEPTGDFKDYLGAVVRIMQEPTSGPQGRSSRAIPSEMVEEPTGETERESQVKRDAAALAKKHAAAKAKESEADSDDESDDDESASDNPYDALDAADREAIDDAIAAGLDSADDLVAMGFADDEETAQAILDAAGAGKKKAPAKKAAAKKGAKKAGKK